MLIATLGLALLRDVPPADYTTQVDVYFRDLIARRKFPAAAVAIVRDGKVEYSKGYGTANLEDDVAATPRTVFRIGSITKQFTATMIMQLVQEGKVKLDEPFETILPEQPKAWAKITVRQLLNHSSGIKSYTGVSGIFNDAALKPVKPEGIVKTVAKEPLEFAPGTQWRYNNTGYELLGMIIEKIDKRPYRDALATRILQPLGMTNTYFVSESVIVKDRAQGYTVSGVEFRHAPFLSMDWPYAAGSIESTVLDLAKWDAALYGESILPQARLEQMWTPTPLAKGKIEQYGFGWSLETARGTKIVEHGGGIHGFTTFIRRAPSKHLTVIVLTNSDASDPEQYARKTMGFVDPSLADQEAAPVLDNDRETDRFAKAMLLSIIAGKLDRSKLTPEFSKFITPEFEKQSQQQLSSMGELNDFTLINTKDENGGKVRTYSVKFASIELKMTFVTTKSGLVAGMGLAPNR